MVEDVLEKTFWVKPICSTFLSHICTSDRDLVQHFITVHADNHFDLFFYTVSIITFMRPARTFALLAQSLPNKTSQCLTDESVSAFP